MVVILEANFLELIACFKKEKKKEAKTLDQETLRRRKLHRFFHTIVQDLRYSGRERLSV